MAHIQDRWERTVDGERVRTTRYGKGKRWQARYRDPDGHERTKDFARKADAERFLATITADVLRGAFVDPHAGKAPSATSPSDGSMRRRSRNRPAKRPSCGWACTPSHTSASESSARSSPR